MRLKPQLIKIKNSRKIGKNIFADAVGDAVGGANNVFLMILQYALHALKLCNLHINVHLFTL